MVRPVAHEVDAGHGDPHRVLRHELAEAGAAGGVVDDRGGDDAVVDDPALAVDVAQERLQRADALGEPRGEPGPVVGGDDPGQQVEREQPLGLVVDPERDAARALLGVQRLLRGLHAVDAHPGERAEHPAVLRQDVALLAHRLVERRSPGSPRAAWAP